MRRSSVAHSRYFRLVLGLAPTVVLGCHSSGRPILGSRGTDPTRAVHGDSAVRSLPTASRSASASPRDEAPTLRSVRRNQALAASNGADEDVRMRTIRGAATAVPAPTAAPAELSPSAPPPPSPASPSAARAEARGPGGAVGLGGLGVVGHGSGGGGGEGYGAAMGRAAPTAPTAASAPARSRGGPTDGTLGRVVDAPVVVGERARAGRDGDDLEEPQAAPLTRVLTAASVADCDRRGNYLSYLERHALERAELGLDMSRRIRVRVVDAAGHPVQDAALSMEGPGFAYRGQTHADGSWDVYPSVLGGEAGGDATLEAHVGPVSSVTHVMLPRAGDPQEAVVVQLPAVIQASAPRLDLGFLIDVTGSMGDELRYIDHEVASIVQRIRNESPGVSVRVGATFYRDRSDAEIVQQIPFTQDVDGFARVMRGVEAGGGGDYPEDMNAGLEAAMQGMAWSDGPAVKVLVVIADAPPQAYPDEQYTWRTAMRDASQRGIRLLPVAASGANRTVEYLFRAMGAATTTPYTYLTDDSGVGLPHMDADTDRVGVERLNDLLTRLVTSDLRGQGMHEPGVLGHERS